MKKLRFGDIKSLAQVQLVNSGFLSLLTSKAESAVSEGGTCCSPVIRGLGFAVSTPELKS